MSETTRSTVATFTEAPYPARAVAWYATAVLSFMFWLSVLDRFVISLLVTPLKHDMGITDTQFGLLNGTAFIVTFAVLGLAVGALADHFSRRWLIFLGVSVWSIATAACGVAHNFGQLFLARIGVGAGEAALTPCATSMLADFFPRERLTLATAMYAIGGTAGAGMAFLIGGSIIQFVSRFQVIAFPLIGDVRSWQAVFVIIGVPGLVLALAVFTVPEPVRRGRGGKARTPLSWRVTYGALLPFMKSRWRFFLWHYVGFAFAAAVIVGGIGWYPTYMSRAFGWKTGRIGLTLGLTIALGGVLGKVLCGNAVDALYRRGYRDAQIRWYAGCLLVAAPAGVIATTSANPWVFLGGIGIVVLLLQPLPACAFTALNLVTRNELRGAGVAFFNATSGLIGSVAGPLLIGALSDHVFKGPAGIGWGIATTFAVCCPLGAAGLALGLRGMREAVRETEQSMRSASLQES